MTFTLSGRWSESSPHDRSPHQAQPDSVGGVLPGARGRTRHHGATKRLCSGLVLSLVLWVVACGGSESAERASSPKSTSTSATTTAPLGIGQQQLAPGRHILDLIALAREQGRTGPAQLPKIQVTVPKGWSNFDGWALGKKRKGEQLHVVAVGFFDVDQLDAHPCTWADKPKVDPGRDVDGLAKALSTRPLRNATDPVDVELSGFRGKYLEWSVPADIDFADCDEGQFQSWTANGWAGGRYQQKPGQVDRIWILDIKGERLVVDGSYLPEATKQERAELERVVESIRFLD